MQTVLIPLNSGLVFTCNTGGYAERKEGLNPFEFRAGIYFRTFSRLTSRLGLNPFEFRAGIYLLPVRSQVDEHGS